MKAEFLPIEKALNGLELIPLPEGCIPLQAIVLIQALDEDGERAWYTRTTQGLGAVESLGAINMAKLLEERRILDEYQPIGDEDDG